MPTRIYWSPPTPPVEAATYSVLSAPNNTTPLTFAETVFDQRPGPHWDETKSKFYMDDPDGTDTTVYRVQSLDITGGLVGDTGLFQPEVSFAANLNTRQRVDHNFGSPNNLQYTSHGVPVAEADIRVYRQPDYDAGRIDIALYIAKTNEVGQWVAPVFLEPGMNYVLVYSKEGQYGPDKVIIEV